MPGWYSGQRGHSLPSRNDVIPRYQSTLERDPRLTQPLLVFVSIKGKEEVRKNGFLNPTSCGTELHIQSWRTQGSAHKLNALLLRENKCLIKDILFCIHHLWPFLSLSDSMPDLLAEKQLLDYCHPGIQNLCSCKQTEKRKGLLRNVFFCFVFYCVEQLLPRPMMCGHVLCSLHTNWESREYYYSLYSNQLWES